MKANESLKPGTFEYIESKIRTTAIGTSHGKDFEKLCKCYLSKSPYYADEIKKIWLWDEWPDRWGRDTGIDIVVLTKDDKYWAVQAKAYHPSLSVTYANISTFISDANRRIKNNRRFDYILLITTTDNLSHNARKALEGQEKRYGLVLRNNLIREEFIWPKDIAQLDAKPKHKPFTPRPHQKTAIHKVITGFKKADRGQLIMACGTGKTLAALWISEKMNSKRTLVLAPSLSLLSQTIQVWLKNRQKDFTKLIVCSDETIEERREDHLVHFTSDLGHPVTTDPAAIKQFLNQKHGKKVVFATYQSSDQIADAMKETSNTFDLVIADEAHRCAGLSQSMFNTVLDDTKIRARKRLFMTATPRILTDRIKKKAQEENVIVSSMDDHHKFGTVLHQLSFDEAIRKQLLSDYQFVAIAVTKSEYADYARKGRLFQISKKHHTDARMLASQIGLLKAIKKYRLRKLITFHSRISRARAFADENNLTSLKGINSALPRAIVPNDRLWTGHISGEMPAATRNVILSKLKEINDDHSNFCGLISNCACLNEGIDVPTLDAIAFIDPRSSVVDIIQAVGRAIRKAENKKTGTIVVPIFIEEKEDPQKIISGSVYQPIWRVINALRAHDKALADEIDALRLNVLQGATRQIKLPAKLKLDLPAHVSLPDFEKAFSAILVERTSISWDAMIKLLQEYISRYGTVSVPLDASGKWKILGEWVHNVRAQKRTGYLSTDRIQQLEEIGFDWRVDGQTLDDTSGLLNEIQFAKKSGFTKIADYRKKDLIKPVGMGISATKLCYLYHPKQINELRKNLGITLTDTSGLLNEKQFINESGFTKVANYRKKGIIKPVGFGLSSTNLSYFYHRKQINELRIILKITLTDTSGLLNEKQFMKISGFTRMADYRRRGLIKPVGFGMSNAGLSPFYHPAQIKELRRKLGITLTNTKGLLNELQFMKISGFTRVADYRKRGLIKPMGVGVSGFFYHPRQIKELRKKLDITLTDTSGLLNEKQFIKQSRFSKVADYYKKGLIKPVGFGMSNAGLSPFYHPRQIKELRRKLGITLTDTSGLINENQFRKKSGLTMVAEYRKKGLIKPVGVGMSASKISFFYHPSQIKELRKKLGY